MMHSDFSHFKSFNNACDFFRNLEPNTSAHYSSTKKEFVKTAGQYSVIPGVQSITDLWKGRTEESIVTDLEKTFGGTFIQDFQTDYEEANKNAEKDPQKLKQTIREFKELGHHLAQARVGLTPKGGLDGFVENMSEKEKEKAKKLISETEKTIQLALTNLQKKDVSGSESLEEPVLDEKKTNEIEKNIEEDKELAKFLKDEEWEIIESDESESKEVTTLAKEAVPFKKMFLYHVTLNYNIAMNTLNSVTGWEWWNKIVDNKNEQIFLGAIPISTVLGRDDSKILANEFKVKAVLSVVEPFEMEGSGITSEQWRNLEVTQLLLPTPDFKTMSFEDIEKGVEFIRENTLKGSPVYIHCKAGRGRSALVLVCYLIKHHHMTADEAIQFVKTNRLQAHLEKAKLVSAHDYEKRCRAEESEEIEEIPVGKQGSSTTQKKSTEAIDNETLDLPEGWEAVEDSDDEESRGS